MTRSVYIHGNPDYSKTAVLPVGGSSRAVPVGFGPGKIMWSTSNASAATVGPSGVVNAVGVGTATITAKQWDAGGGLTQTAVDVRVEQPAPKLTLDAGTAGGR